MVRIIVVPLLAALLAGIVVPVAAAQPTSISQAQEYKAVVATGLLAAGFNRIAGNSPVYLVVLPGQDIMGLPLGVAYVGNAVMVSNSEGLGHGLLFVSGLPSLGLPVLSKLGGVSRGGAILMDSMRGVRWRWSARRGSGVYYILP